MKATIGLRKKDTYEELINYLLTDQDVVRYPDRRAKQLRESPYLTQLDGEGLGEMQDHQERQFREEQKQNVIRQVASTSSKSVSQIKAESAHRESFSQTDATTPDVKMSATADTQTEEPVMVDSGTGSDPPPPPTAGAVRMERGTSPLPPPHHYMHLNVDQPPPPPPPPEAPRIRKSTSDAGTQDDSIMTAQATGGQPPPPAPPGVSSYAKARTKRSTPYDAATASSSSGKPPPPPPSQPQAYYIGDTPMGSAEDRAYSIEMRRADEERKLWEARQEKRERVRTAFRQHLMEISHHAMKRAAEEASNSVAEQALELAHAAAKARRASEMQSKSDRLSMQEEMKRQAALQAAQLDAAKRELSAHHRARAESHQKRVAVEKAELDGQRQQMEAQKQALEKAKLDRELEEVVSKQQAKQPRQPKPPKPPKPARTPKPKKQAAPVRSVSAETTDWRAPASRSRSRAKSSGGPVLPIVGEEVSSVEPVKKPRGRPRTKEVVEVVKKPRGRPKSKA